ncbi:MAG: TerB family tellurite resistance protein [Cyclobacteriaceae bacterium]|nr:TerB family tellurite resistance protein [Cyclobacteriaceae bacterium]
MTDVLVTKYYRSALLSLYHLLIEADGHVSSKELEMGEIMRVHEGIPKSEFENLITSIRNLPGEQVLEQCINYLRKTDLNHQVKCLAWLSLIANSDGFMDTTEWALIYRIYAKELKLDLAEIMKKQRELSKTCLDIKVSMY